MTADLLARVQAYRAAYFGPGDGPHPRVRPPFAAPPEPLGTLLDDIERHLEAQS